MRTSAVQLFCCPGCHSQLKLLPITQSGPEVISGELICEQCGQRYPIVRRMPWLYIDDERWQSKAREAEGWVKYHQKLNLYETSDLRIDSQLPYYPEEPWLTVARHFDSGLKLAELSGREVVLDLGAGRGWAAKQFALKDCRVAAIDVVADERVGLGRAWALMDEAGVCFDPAIGDNENLPFFSETFDLVFCAAVLHHTSDLPGLLQSVHRVLKPGGRLVAVNEPCISLFEDEQAVLQRDASEELASGINESRPNYLDYLTALHNAGFQSVSMTPVDAFAMNDHDLESWAVQLGAVPPQRLRAWHMRDWWVLRGGKRVLRGYLLRRKMRSLQPHLPDPLSHREELLQAILIHTSGSVIITARK